jgi:hypothetical protein
MFKSKMIGVCLATGATLVAPIFVGMGEGGPIVAQESLGLAAQSSADWFDVPLRIDDGRLLVPVQIGQGVEVDFIVSTANTVTVLNQAFIDNHGVDGDFFLGDIEVNLENYATVPNEQLNSGTSTIVGIIGANTLNEFDLLFDVPDGRLVMKEVGRAMDFEGASLGEVVRLRVYHGLLLGLDVDVAGATLPALLDTGADGVLANSAGARAIGVSDGGSAVLTAGATAFGTLPITVSDSPLMERWDPNGDGFIILGAPITIDCALAISWVHREMRRCVS